tara:strand:- start:306 stop:1310 length:1005 start_codon:yes stop_codon:yes gene_type:complete
MSENIFEEFLDFFNSLLIGYSENKGDNDEVLNQIQSSSMMEALSLSLTNTLKNFTNTIEQNVYADKTITVDCGSDKLTAWHLKPMGQKYTWYGAKIPNTSCIKYGCCYDVIQTANVSLSAINVTNTNDYKGLWTNIRQEMTNQVTMTLGDNDQRLQILNQAMNEVEAVSITKIQRILENFSLSEIESIQEITFTSLSPLRCKNRCDEPPSAGFIEQSLNVEIATNNIITEVIKSVTENYITMTSQTKTEVSNISLKKIYIFAVFSCLLVITIFIISYLIVYFVAKYFSAGLPPPSILVYVGATILTVVILMFWAIVLCIIRANGKLGALFCMIR